MRTLAILDGCTGWSESVLTADHTGLIVSFVLHWFISSPEHEVLKVSCCDLSMFIIHSLSSVVHRALNSVNNLLYKPTPPTTLGQWIQNLVVSIGMTCRSKTGNIVPTGNPRWPSWLPS